MKKTTVRYVLVALMVSSSGVTLAESNDHSIGDLPKRSVDIGDGSQISPISPDTVLVPRPDLGQIPNMLDPVAVAKTAARNIEDAKFRKEINLSQ